MSKTVKKNNNDDNMEPKCLSEDKGFFHNLYQIPKLKKEEMAIEVDKYVMGWKKARREQKIITNSDLSIFTVHPKVKQQLQVLS